MSRIRRETTDYLARTPRMVGVLFLLFLLTANGVGTVAGAAGGTTHGP